MSLKEIITGWANVVFTDEQIEELSKQRLSICNACEHKDELKMIKADICNKCGCPLIAKTRSPESKCPINKWDNIVPNSGSLETSKNKYYKYE